MNIEEAKRIPLEDYLRRMGFSPVKEQGDSLWYRSPFRQERTPSFKVSLSRNLWIDFGEGTGGSVIDLAQRLYGTRDISSVLRNIEGCFPVFTPTLEPRKTAATPSAFEELRVSPLRNTVLLDYLAKRGIPSGIAVRECVEVHYRTRGKWYFGIGFRNRKGGMEIRNPYFKGSTSPKDISHVRHSTDKNERSTVLVFEGFMDYLSYLALKQGQPMPDCVVLNSVGNLAGALDVLKGYGHVCCFLDNDDAGRRTTEEIRRRCGSVTDKAVHYLPHKDLNEFLQHRMKKTVETCAEPKQESGWKIRR